MFLSCNWYFQVPKHVGIVWIILPLHALLTHFSTLKLSAAFLPTRFYEALHMNHKIMDFTVSALLHITEDTDQNMSQHKSQ